MNLFHWLRDQALFPKVYYCDKESGIERAAVGALRTFSTPPQEKECCYGGVAFPSSKREKEWEPYGSCQFWQPIIEKVQKLQRENEPQKNRHEIVHREESHTFASFAQQIALLNRAIENAQVDKVVLARKSTLTLKEAPCVWGLIESLKIQNATLFAFQMDEKNAFFGATPETFFRRKDSSLTIDALAGSSRGAMRDKERREFAFVKQFIESAVKPFVNSLTWSEERLLETAHLSHLYSRADLKINERYSDSALILALHPTPAVGGTAQQQALKWIEMLEPFQRGWYASPVGYVSSKETHLSVALRSARLEANRLHLFAGAGIVAGSTAQEEWDEINVKMQLLYELF